MTLRSTFSAVTLAVAAGALMLLLVSVPQAVAVHGSDQVASAGDARAWR